MWKLLVIALTVALALFMGSDVDLPMMLLPYEAKGSFAGKVVWITGASSGIGAALAEDMVKAGATVIISARREEMLNSVADSCAKFGERPYVLPLDMTDFEAHTAAFENVIQKFGHVDSLVLNAGASHRSTAMSTPLQVTKDLMQLNFMSFVSLTKVVLPSMIERKQGQITVTSSLSGVFGTPASTSYSATKFALHGYFNALRAEVAQHGINVLIACPGPVESEISAKAYRPRFQSEPKDGAKMPTARCSFLMAKAMYYRIMEVWISEQPLLTATYLAQYAPTLNNYLFAKVVGPARIKAVQSGEDPFDFRKLLGI